MQGLTTFNRHRASQPVNFRPESAEREFSMIASAHGLRYRGMSLGQQSGKQQRGLDLGAGYGHQILDAVQPGARYAQRRAAVFTRMNLRRPSWSRAL